MRLYHLDQVERLFHRALLGGGRRLSFTQCEWDVSGRCFDPTVIEIAGRPDACKARGPILNDGGNLYAPPFPERHVIVEPGPSGRWDQAGTRFPLSVTLMAPCRRCGPCLRVRRRLWADRAFRETMASTRTWFGTLTFAADVHYRADTLLRREGREKAAPFDALSSREQYAARSRVLGREVQLWLKRVRKETGSPIRYIAVSEPHDGDDPEHQVLKGRPHFHYLLHERDPFRPVVKEVQRRQWFDWGCGFMKLRLVAHEERNPEQARKAANYVAKYLAKNAWCRIRSSQANKSTGARSYGDALPWFLETKSVIGNDSIDQVVTNHPPTSQALLGTLADRWA